MQGISYIIILFQHIYAKFSVFYAKILGPGASDPSPGRSKAQIWRFRAQILRSEDLGLQILWSGAISKGRAWIYTEQWTFAYQLSCQAPASLSSQWARVGYGWMSITGIGESLNLGACRFGVGYGLTLNCGLSLAS